MALPNVGHFTTKQQNEALDWLHPLEGQKRPSLLSNTAMKNRAILATKNEKVDEWNKIIQDMNTNPAKTLLSHDYFADVDDPNGHLASMLTEQALNSYTNNHVPNHELILKVNDVCFITRPMKASGLASNSRVRILSIREKLIIVKRLDDPDDGIERHVMVPRMRFKFSLKGTSSFKMTRVAFPLRLCYAMTINKSQGQSFEQVLIDYSDDAFSHGHVYVSLSRARYFNQVMLIVREDSVVNRAFIDADGVGEHIRDAPVLINTVYPSVIKLPPV
jgi:ATP-dependent DNA helicase PIF1